jgi:AcrR family transcriptional regulator
MFHSATMDTEGMDQRAKRIVEIAVGLAERDGFAAVRMRDVASQAGVALGTLYRRFRSKEEILLAALQMESMALAEILEEHPVHGDTPRERLRHFFSIATHGLCSKPNLARALLRSIASAEAGVTEKVAQYHAMITRLITAAMRGGVLGDGTPTDDETTVAFLLQHVWFATLVGWAGGLHDTEQIIEQVMAAADLLLRGMERK